MMECMRLIIGEVGMRERERERERHLTTKQSGQKAPIFGDVKAP